MKDGKIAATLLTVPKSVLRSFPGTLRHVPQGAWWADKSEVRFRSAFLKIHQYTFRKQDCMPITRPKHEPIKKVYVEMVRQIVESEV